MDIVNLAIKVATTEVDKAQKGLQDLQGELEKAESLGYKFGSAIGSSIKMAATAFVGLGSAIGGATLLLANQIDDLQDAADMYGYSAIQISAMKTAAQAAGGSLEDVMMAATRARKEVAQGGEAFKNLGISMLDANGKLKDGATLAGEVATKYREGSTTAAQFADVQSVLGKDVDKVATVLASQAQALELVNDLQARGIGIVNGSITATNEFSDAKNKANLVMQAAGSILVAKVLPAFTTLIKALTDSYVNGGLVKQAFDGLIAMLPGFITFGAFITKIFITAGNTVRAFGDTLGAIGGVVGALLDGNWSGAMEIAKAWKGGVDAIDEQNRRALAGVDATAQGMRKAIEAADLTLQTSGSGRDSKGGPGKGGGGGDKLVPGKDADGPYKEYLRMLDEKAKRELEDLKRYEAREAAADREAEALSRLIQGYQDMADPMSALVREQLQLEQLMEKWPQHADVLWAAWNKIQDKIDEAGKKTKGAAEEMSGLQRIGETAFQGLESSLMNFVETGKFSFKGFVSSILKDIARLIIQIKIIEPIMKAFRMSMGAGGGGWGSLFGNIVGAFGGGKATGGPVSGNTTYLVGEKGPELFVPKQAGTIIPNHAMGGGGQTNQIQINVTVEGGKNAEETANAVAMKTQELFVRGVVRQELKTYERGRAYAV